jgi:ABC-type lipoprotein release transport system permease subunit
MTAHSEKPESEGLKKEIERLKGLLEEEKNLRQEAQETLEAIRTGAVDGIVRSTPEGEQVFILKGSDQPYIMHVFFHPRLIAIVMCIFLFSFVAVLASINPSRRASKISIVEALRWI